MNTDFDHIKSLVERPSESLNVELKRWIDPSTPEGKSKIVKALLALRNHNGGYLIIGFDDKTREPDDNNRLSDIKSAFHSDEIQRLISSYASENFEISVHFPKREEQIYPVIAVPTGVKTPVVSKSSLKDNNNGKELIAKGDIYVRSLQSNYTPSTAKVGLKDWSKLLDTCFDNREADIARFIRRQLNGLNHDQIVHIKEALTSTLIGMTKPEHNKENKEHPSPQDLLKQYLQESEKRFAELKKEKYPDEEFPPHGTWEVALKIDGKIPEHSVNENFLSLLASSNPRHTGWPVWLDNRNFTDERFRPHILDGTWESLIFCQLAESTHIDYMRLNPKGLFYLRRALQDDVSPRSIGPLSVLDFALPILRSTEAIAVGIAFAKAMGCDSEDTNLAFVFRWTKLKGRELASWVEAGRFIPPGYKAYQDECTTFVNVPLDTPLSSLSEYVNKVTQPLYEVFNGFSLSMKVIEDLTNSVLNRKF